MYVGEASVAGLRHKTKGARFFQCGCGFAVFTSQNSEGFVIVTDCFVAVSIVASCHKPRQSMSSTCGQVSTIAARSNRFLPACCILWANSLKYVTAQ